MAAARVLSSRAVCAVMIGVRFVGFFVAVPVEYLIYY